MVRRSRRTGRQRPARLARGATALGVDCRPPTGGLGSGMPTIAIVGPGAIGGILAAWLAQDPDNDVTVCARTAFDRLEVETPTGHIEAFPRVLVDPADATPVDWVLIATKAYDA